MGYWIQGQGGLLKFIESRPDICRNFDGTIEAMFAVYPKLYEEIKPRVLRPFRPIK